MTSGVSRWMDRFHEPGPYRLEVLRTDGAVAEVVFLFTLWVDAPPEEPALLGESMTTVADPIAAESTLFDRLDALRRARGLGGVQRFDAFLPVTREHSAFMAATGVVAHQIPGVTDGVAARIQGAFHPRPVLHEDVAAAASAASAAALVEDSPRPPPEPALRDVHARRRRRRARAGARSRAAPASSRGSWSSSPTGRRGPSITTTADRQGSTTVKLLADLRRLRVAEARLQVVVARGQRRRPRRRSRTRRVARPTARCRRSRPRRRTRAIPTRSACLLGADLADLAVPDQVLLRDERERLRRTS